MNNYPEKSALTIQLLGPPQIRLDQTDLPFRLAKEYALVYYLAATAQPHKRSDLADAFWPDSPPGIGRRHLRNRLVVLRRHLGDYMQITKDALGFDPSLVVVDMHELLAHLPRNGQLDPAQIPHYRRAVDLYRGDFLAGFDIPNTPMFSDWMMDTREALQTQVATLLYRLSQAEIAQGNRPQAHSDLEQLLALIPWHEEAHQLKMQLLYEDGQRWAALEQYATLQTVLREELDVDPSVEIAQLIARIRADDYVVKDVVKDVIDDAIPQARETATASTHLPKSDTTTNTVVSDTSTNQPPPLVEDTRPEPVRWHVTKPFGRLFGRAKELAQLTTYLASPMTRLITITGMGGVGKSRLAIEVIVQQQEQFEHGVALVSLQGIQSSTEDAVQDIETRVADAICLTLDLPVEASTTPVQKLLDELREKELCLLLDNFEDILEASSLISRLLSHAPRLHVLVTSRAPLTLHDEVIVMLSGLSVPTADAGQTVIDALVKQPSIQQDLTTEYEALALFVEFAKAKAPTYTFPDSDWPHIVALCQFLDGMPLAIEMATQWLVQFSPADLVAQLTDSLNLLVNPMRDAPTQHANMHVILESSWHYLSAQEQHTIALLSIFAHHFTQTAITQVIEVDAFTILQLLQKSWIQSLDGSYYQLHPLVKQFATNHYQTLPPEMQRGVQERYADFYCTQAASISQVAQDADQPSYSQNKSQDKNQDNSEDKFHQLWDMWLNLERGLQWYAEHAPERLGPAVLALKDYWERTGYWSRARWWIKQALTLLYQRDDTTMSLSTIAELYYMSSLFAQRQQDLDEAKANVRHASKIYDRLDDIVGMAKTVERQGWITFEQKQYTDAYAYFERARDLFETLDDLEMVANQCFALASTAMRIPNLKDQVDRHIQQSLTLSEQTDYAPGIARCMQALARIAIQQAKTNLAIRYCDRALALAKFHTIRNGVAFIYLQRGELALAIQDWQTAEHYIRLAKTEFQLLAIPYGLCATQADLAIVAHGQGDIETAKTRYLAALKTIMMEERWFLGVRVFCGLAYLTMNEADEADEQGDEEAIQLLCAAAPLVEEHRLLLFPQEIQFYAYLKEQLAAQLGQTQFEEQWVQWADLTPQEVARLAIYAF
ncbi:MAG: BTAD domain-containing putative transcriptional regulator [Chloroflexota bacterium]